MALDTTIGGPDADSYGTLAAYTTYASSMGWTLASTDAANEVSLRKAAVALDRENTFIGLQQYQAQARAFPRLIGDLVDGWPVDPDTIPQDIIYAQFEMGYLIQGGLDPFATIESSSTSESIKVGPITIAGDSLPTGKARVVAVEGLLRPYIGAGSGQVRLVRA